MQKQLTLFLTFSFFILISCLLIFSQILLPVRIAFGMISFISQPLQVTTYKAFANSNVLSSTEKNLQDKINKLRTELVQQEQLKNENIALKDQFATDMISTKQLLPAQIIGMPRFIPGISEPETIILDKGENNQIRVGTIVVYKNMLVGKVARVLPTLSVVNLITNTTISFTGETLKTNALGVVRGKGQGKIAFENVVLADSLEKNDTIFTKGNINESNEGFPPQLLIGTITDVNKTPSALFQSASIKLPFDITHMTTVFLLVK